MRRIGCPVLLAITSARFLGLRPELVKIIITILLLLFTSVRTSFSFLIHLVTIHMKNDFVGPVIYQTHVISRKRYFPPHILNLSTRQFDLTTLLLVYGNEKCFHLWPFWCVHSSSSCMLVAVENNPHPYHFMYIISAFPSYFIIVSTQFVRCSSPYFPSWFCFNNFPF